MAQDDSVLDNNYYDEKDENDNDGKDGKDDKDDNVDSGRLCAGHLSPSLATISLPSGAQ